MPDFDVLVIGGGHAGVEAVLAAARMGLRAAVVVLDPAAIGRMSCNPAIGGIAKGQLVREIDALGGEMGLCTDATGIQFRMLNTSKGPAVRSPRAQCDRAAYNAAMARRVAAQPGLAIVRGEAVDILVRGSGATRRVCGVRLAAGDEVAATAVVLTTGTFLGGKLFAGPWESAGGRMGEPGAARLSRSLAALGLRLGRHKTGTPPRLHRDSIDLAATTAQPGDREPRPFSFRTGRLEVEQIDCYLTRTVPATHRIIAANAHLSPMVQGRITGVGPRYCPSVEDKVVRFADQQHHQVFLEPEGRDSDEVYPNGLSTSLPPEVQEAFLRTIPGLEEVRVTRHGYAVEYDHLVTDQIRGDLHVADVRGLFAAGQVNGTSGYEEAAGQGIIAGINAALFARGEPPVVLDRASSYIGVMVDDLCRVNPREPYRMFTSRAEYRLLLRADNADRRLSALGHRLGLLDARAHDAVQRKEAAIARTRQHLCRVRVDGRTLEDRLRRPDVRMVDLVREHAALAALRLDADVVSEVEAEVKYEGYVERQSRAIARLRALEGQRLPAALDYTAIAGLSAEARERLLARRPLTLGEATRVPGVTPADVQLLLAVLARRQRQADDLAICLTGGPDGPPDGPPDG